MNIVSEMITADIIDRNEQQKDDPIPTGAFPSFEAFCNYVNTHQLPSPEGVRPNDIYANINNPIWEFLQQEVIPDTMAVVYVVVVPQQSKHAHALELYVPAFDELVHDPDMFGISEALDAERRLQVPRHFKCWYRLGERSQQMSLQYKHIDTLGLVPDRRSNNWMTFMTRTDAMRYVTRMKYYDRQPSPRSMTIMNAIAGIDL